MDTYQRSAGQGTGKSEWGVRGRQIPNFREGTPTIPWRRSLPSGRSNPGRRALDPAGALHREGTERTGTSPKTGDCLGDSGGGGGQAAGRGAGRGARDPRRGHPGSAHGRGGWVQRRGVGWKEHSESERKDGTEVGPRPGTALCPAALTRLRGARAPSPPPPHTKAPARRARPDKEAAPPAAARLSIRRAARRTGPGRPRRPARSAPRRPGGGSAPRRWTSASPAAREEAAPPHGGDGSEAGGVKSHQAWGPLPRPRAALRRYHHHHHHPAQFWLF
ncbi:translation initiation factor IF-2-like [Rhinolophus ferrumequinum]|uniref:translation initiation factor IF-2-like n=1 Tax=Rhinolophus ferrumequinum TaxID=59479 RepID=UPI00140FACC8|nr:translation initiation factor IF-2-like [Rhinolophus ferrumequinum]